MIKMIVAADEEGGIGKGGGIPWSIRNDLSFFRFMTYGDDVVMGRKTYENTPELEGRRLITLTRQDGYDAPRVASTLREVVSHRQNIENKTLWVGGGGSVYLQYMGTADEVILSRIEGSYDCDTFFPMDKLEEHYEMVGRFTAQGFQAQRYKLK